MATRRFKIKVWKKNPESFDFVPSFNSVVEREAQRYMKKNYPKGTKWEISEYYT